MTKISFDPTDRSIHGPFKSLAALKHALVKADTQNPDYQAWAKKFEIDPASGSFITTSYNSDLLERRRGTLEQQLLHFKGFAETDLKFTIPTDLHAAFTEAATGHPDGKPFKLWVHSTTRETLFFDLRKAFPQLDLHADHVVADDDYVAQCNELVARLAPELSQKLTYTSAFRQSGSFDLASVNSSAIYEDAKGLDTLAWVIAQKTGAERVVFNNMQVNKDANGAEQWFAQRYSGGVIPFRIPAQGEIETAMKKNGYILVTAKEAETTYDVDPTSDFKKQVPTQEHFSFVRKPAPKLA